MGNVQVCNISKEEFESTQGKFVMGTASAKVTSSGQSTGRLAFHTAPVGIPVGQSFPVTLLEIDKVAQTAKLHWGATGQNFVAVKGTFEHRIETINEIEVPTDSLHDNTITGIRIGGVDYAPVVDPDA